MNTSTKVKVFNLFRKVFQVPMLEKILAQQTSDKDPSSMISKLVPNPYQYKPGTNRSITRDGITLNVDISDYIGHYVYFGFKDSSLDKYYSLIKPGQNVLDIGANVGLTVLKSAKLLQGKGKVIGFEPDPYNFNRLKDNISLNSFKNIEIYNFGLGDTKSVQKLHIETASNRGGNKINNNATENFSLIEIIRLDDFIDEKVSQKIDLIKIDVEGFELRVFSGAQNVLRTHKPILFIEVDDNNLKAQGDSSQKLMQFLTDLGYGRIERADTNEKITPQYNFKNTHFDVLCYPS